MEVETNTIDPGRITALRFRKPILHLIQMAGTGITMVTSMEVPILRLLHLGDAMTE
jgi:hypothetical protein